MNILFLNNYHYIRGGSERVFFGEMDLLRANGQKVQSFARAHADDVSCETASFFPPHIETESVSLSWRGLKTFREILYSTTARTALKKLLLSFRPDIVHAHNIYGRLTSAVLDLLRAEQIPVVMTLHDYKLICPSYKLMRNHRVCEDCRGGRYYMAIKNRCHKNSAAASAAYALESGFNDWLGKYRKNIRFFIAPSRFLKNKLIDFGWDAEQIVYVPNFVDPAEQEQNGSSADNADKAGNYFLYFGRLSQEKGVEDLVRAFMRLPDNAVRLRIAGDGPLKSELTTLAAQDARISFEGYLSGNRLRDMISGARAVVVPSKWYENAPLSILEAMAAGKPIIGAAIGGIPEMVRDNVTGYLFAPGDLADLTNKMQVVLQAPPENLVIMGRAARNAVASEFNPRTHYDQLMAVYARALTTP